MTIFGKVQMNSDDGWVCEFWETKRYLSPQWICKNRY